jgi:hypothetical protein
MRDSNDVVTGELVPVKRGRGRPKTGNAMTPAERQAAYRARHELEAVTVQLPRDLVAALNEYLKFKDTTKNEVFAKLLRSQLLRKR